MFGSVRTILAIGLSILLGAPALHAQLDPRLQTSNTDFLDLYQQSTSLKAKPEIVSIFDFSRSMASVMFHPLYRNDDVADADDYRYMKFQLTDAGGGSAPNNRWWIIGRAGNDANAYTRSYVTVNPDGTATLTYYDNPVDCRNMVGNNLCNYQTGNNIPANFYITAQSVGNGSAWSRAYFNPVSTAAAPVGINDHTNYSQGTNTTTGSFGSPSYTMSTFTVAPAGPWAPNTTITVSAILTHPWTEGEDITHRNINLSMNGGTGFTSGPTWSQIDADHFKVTATFKIPDFVHTTTILGDKTQLAVIQATPGSPFAAAATISFKSYFLTQGTGANNNKINWTVSAVDTTNYCGLGIPTITAQTTATNAGYAPATAATFTIPSYRSCANTGATAPYVTVSLDASVGSAYNSGLAYPGALSQTTSAASPYEVLRKPDGTAVTQADAAAASGTLEGASLGVRDVRNWVRAASHVRFKSGTRTIDIPIPWKLMNLASSGSPLSSRTILDQQIKTVGGVSTTYGSGLNLEMDTCYKVENFANGVFTVDTNGNVPPLGNTDPNRATVVYLYGAAYRPAYIAWLFNGKYQNTVAANANYTTKAALVGKYVAFDANDDTKAYGQLGNVGWGRGFGPAGTSWGNLNNLPMYDAVGTYTGDSTVPADASGFAIPAVTRVQATKQAAITTWINHQADVIWAYRNLDITNESGGGTGTNIDNNSATTKNAADPTATHVDGLDSGWTVLNNTSAQGITSTTGNSVVGMKRIAALFPNAQTPLTYAVARALAQFNDPNSVFNPIVGANVSQCVNQFLLLFTDGIDNNGIGVNNPNAATPYITGSGAGLTFNALTGNQAILATPSLINRSGANWNLYTFSGMAAHLSDPAMGTLGVDYMKGVDPGGSTTTGTPSAFLPFSVKKRNGILYDKDHRVTTMTIGVSLGGKYTDPTSPKRSLFAAAVIGDPATNSGLLSGFHTFVPPTIVGTTVTAQNDWLPDPQDPVSYPTVGIRAPGAVYFFDATDPAKLVTSMDYAFRIAISSGGNNATASPNIPFIGASFGKQIYIGQFQPPKAGGVIWSGDLMSFGTREVGGNISITDSAGNVTTTLDQTTAIWSAASRLSTLLWKSRSLFTRLPGTAAMPERGFHAFTDTTAAFTASDAPDNTAGLKNYLAATHLTVGSPEQKALAQNAMGGNTLGVLDGASRPTTNRLSIMGDIIDSAPAVLEYKFNDTTISTGIGVHAPLSSVGGNRFRAILVGDNQGWLHCFGEVTKTSNVTVAGSTYEIAQGAVDELWAFMPTDFLANLDYAFGASVGTNTHRFMVDGSPNIYFLDLPPVSGGSGNGVLDNGAGSQERAIAIVGLRKGGRSYYAINIKDPFNPSLQWSIVPDEASLFPASRNLTGLGLATVQTIIANMGYSTSAPSLGRVAFTYGGTTKLRDVVFLGGGHSVPEVEANFLASGKTILLGRSVLAVDVSTGEVLSAVDMTALPGVVSTLGNPSTCSVGPISAGLVPFEFILNSGMAQRAYFLDFKGGLWAWGSKAVADASAGGLENYRMDNSDLAKWTTDGTTSGSAGIRKVAQDGTGNNALYSTLPAPFRVGAFPGVGKTVGAPAPAAVGVAMVSGNRNNPVDFLYSAGTKPSYHRLTVVFDRQDSRAWGLDSQSGPDAAIQDSNLMNFTANNISSDPGSTCPGGVWSTITPSCPEFYLAPASGNPAFGYYVQFPGVDGKVHSQDVAPLGFIPKGVTSPMVVAGSLFYSYFWPATADPCTGGSGTSYSNLIPDAVAPIVTDSRTGIFPKAGIVAQWSGVASDYIAFGTRGVVQGGTVPVANPPVGGATTTLALRTQSGKSSERYPKARIWRTVH